MEVDERKVAKGRKLDHQRNMKLYCNNRDKNIFILITTKRS
jgi:hypothetical protein